jgi:organic radical activating enzyme
MLLNMTKTYCPLAWNHFSTHTDGNMRLCCNSTNAGRLKKDGKFVKINEITSLIEFYNIDQLKNIRKKMIDGERVAECQHCYNVEDNGGESVRNWFVKRWPIEDIITNTEMHTGKLESVDVNYLDLSWSNKCNLQCKMCTPGASDQLIKEFKFLNIKPWGEKESDYKAQWNYDQIKHILDLVKTDGLVQILVTGGEPLINNDFYTFCKELISSGLSKQVDLSIHTNLTVTPSKWFDIWSHFKTMTIKVSIDAVADMYEYIRYPGKWNIVKDNIDSIVQYSNENENIGIEFHTVFSIFNTHKFTELLDYIVRLEGKNILNFPHINYIYDPSYASPSNLPTAYKNTVYQEIATWFENNRELLEKDAVKEKANILSAMITFLIGTPESDINFKNSVSIIKKMDAYRNHNTEKYLPWWKN